MRDLLVGDAPPESYKSLIKHIPELKGVEGMTIEVGLRRGGGTANIVDAFLKNDDKRVHICVDPYGNIEYYDLAEKLGADWNQIVEGVVADPRIGNSHSKVPGHDGKRGFGGTCFPKDINAIIEFSKNNNVEMNTLEAAWKTNLRVRPEQDWKQLKGRAVS